mmetsp:Transcript_29418/g.47205  ORF Transcript_29418/g.47205 Transcript_29418/m.47205 type:complete len:237 (+) Transcript_29418:796-1506(+)
MVAAPASSRSKAAARSVIALEVLFNSTEFATMFARREAQICKAEGTVTPQSGSRMARCSRLLVVSSVGWAPNMLSFSLLVSNDSCWTLLTICSRSYSMSRRSSLARRISLIILRMIGENFPSWIIGVLSSFPSRSMLATMRAQHATPTKNRRCLPSPSESSSGTNSYRMLGSLGPDALSALSIAACSRSLYFHPSASFSALFGSADSKIAFNRYVSSESTIPAFRMISEDLTKISG